MVLSEGFKMHSVYGRQVACQKRNVEMDIRVPQVLVILLWNARHLFKALQLQQQTHL